MQRMRLIAYVTSDGRVIECSDIGTNTFHHFYNQAPSKVRYIVAEVAANLDEHHAHAIRFVLFDIWEAGVVLTDDPYRALMTDGGKGAVFPDPAAAIMAAILHD